MKGTVQCELSDMGGIYSVNFQLQERSETITKVFLTKNILKCMLTREHMEMENIPSANL